jgi:hypothetical protein
MHMHSPWLTLESISGLVAIEPVWRKMLGDQFAAFKTLCLQLSSWKVRYYPCPHGCGCEHVVIPRHDGTGALAVCRCVPGACPDIPLTTAEISPYEVNLLQLGQALCKAFGFPRRHADLGIPFTFQFGSWSTDSVPAILTIQVRNSAFRSAVAELAAQLRQPFLLFAPTSDFLDAPSQAILQNHGAAFFALDTHVVLKPEGTLQPTRPPAELFARFTPQPKEADLDLARRVFAVVQNLDTEKPLQPPTLLAVFRQYCIEELSASAIAREYKCSKPTILRRLALIRLRTGLDPLQLRRLSPHIAQLEDSFTDSRAAHLRRQTLIDADEGEE